MDALNNLSEGMKNFYYFFEDKWYDLLDKIDSKVPIYPVVDKVDAVIPSFILFLLTILFMVILVGYFIQFSSPIDVTFTTLDSTTQSAIGAVNIKTVILAQAEEGTTNSEGKFSVKVIDSSKNIYAIIGEMLFGRSEADLKIEVAARKSGYNDFSDIFYEGREHKLLLSPVSIPEPNIDFAGQTQIRLVNINTNTLIIDNTAQAYVTFSCNNKNIGTRTVNSNNGIFTLTEPECEFKFEEAFSPGFVKNSNPKILPLGVDLHTISLREMNNTGNVKIWVFADNNKNAPVSGATVTIGENNTGTTNNSGFVSITNITPGDYNILVTKQGFHTITDENKIEINIVVGSNPDKEIYLTSIVPGTERKVHLKVVDAVDGNLLSGVRVILRSISSTGYVQSLLNSRTTDANGTYLFDALNTAHENKLVLTLEKEGYLITPLTPILFKLTEGPQIVNLEKANATNSGFSDVNVSSSSGDVQRPLQGATAMMVISDFNGIKNLPIAQKITNDSGKAIFNSLPKDYNYFAQAEYQGASGTSTNTEFLDANKTIYFNVIIGLDISKIVLTLKNSAGQIVTDANVNLYQANSNFTSLTFKEKMTLTSNKFNSGFYSKANNYYITIDANGYISEVYPIDLTINPLQNGINNIEQKLINPNDLNPDPSSDRNVLIEWMDVYKLIDPFWGAPSTLNILFDNNFYRAKVNAIINENNLDYNILYEMIRVKNAEITNIYLGRPYGENLRSIVSCSNESQDTSSNPRGDSYYVRQTGEGCLTGQKIVAGAKWAAQNVTQTHLPKGSYPIMIEFKVKLETDQNEIIFNYRAKEENQTSNSETTLKEKRIKIGEPFREGIYLTANVNNSPINFDNNVGEIGVVANENNQLEIKIFNGLINPTSNVKLTIYSHNGAPSTFNETIDPTGFITFGTNKTKTATLASNITIPAGSNTAYTTDFNFPETTLGTGYIVIVFEQGTKKETYFILVSTEGMRIGLKDAVFLSGVSNQKFKGEIFPRTSLSNREPEIQTINIKVYKDGNADPKYDITATNTAEGIKPDKKSFEIIIPENYVSTDYLDITIVAKDKSTGDFYETFTKRFYATADGTVDRTLACVDIYETGNFGETNRMTLNWGDQKNLTIKNNCEQKVILYVESGLECKFADNQSCRSEKQLDQNNTIQINITGRNTSFDGTAAAPNFTDILGLFPVYVKARFENRSLFSNAANFSVKLQNPNQCFDLIIDWPEFNYSSISAPKDIRVESHCYSRDIKDYFIPRLDMRAFGYEIEPNTLVTNENVDFDVSIELDGVSRVFVTETREINEWGNVIYIHAEDITGANKIPQAGELAKYKTTFDFSNDLPGLNTALGASNWKNTRFQIKIVDNRTRVPTNYGAKIDGDIKITYENNETALIPPAGNFGGLNYSSATGNAHVTSGTAFWGLGIPANALNVDEDKWYGGVIYQPIAANKKIKKVEIDFIARDVLINDALMLGVWPELTYTQTYTREDTSGSANAATIEIGNYRIPKIGGVKWVLATVQDLKNRGYFQDEEFISRLNPSLNRIIANNPDVKVWTENGFLYARYIGESPYISTVNPKYIDGLLKQTVGSGELYGIITAEDYVISGTGLRVISGNATSGGAN